MAPLYFECRINKTHFFRLFFLAILQTGSGVTLKPNYTNHYDNIILKTLKNLHIYILINDTLNTVLP